MSTEHLKINFHKLLHFSLSEKLVYSFVMAQRMQWPSAERTSLSHSNFIETLLSALLALFSSI